MIVRELITKLGFNVDPTGVQEANRRVDEFEKKVKKASQEVRNFGLAFTAFVSAPIALAGASALKTASDFEQLQVAYETMLGSADRAKKLTQDLQDFAKTTPFNIDEVQRSAKSLMAYGVEADDIIPKLRMLGDITAGVGRDKLPQLILAFGQVKAQTVLAGQELRQFTETGIPLLPALEKVTGYTVKQIAQDGKRLGITFAQVDEALRSMTEPGGKFFNLMAKQSKTLGGEFSNLQDSVTFLKAEFGALFSDEAKTVIKWFREMIEVIRKLNPETKKMIGYFAIFLAILGPVITLLGQLGLAIIGAKTLFTSFGVILTAISGEFLIIAACVGILAAALFLIYDDFKTFFEGGDSILGIMVDFGKSFLKFGEDLAASWRRLFSSMFDDVKITFQNMKDFVKNPIQGVKKLFNGDYGKNYSGETGAAWSDIKNKPIGDTKTRPGFNFLSQSLYDYNEKMNGPNMSPQRVTVDQLLNGNGGSQMQSGPSWFDFMSGMQGLNSAPVSSVVGPASSAAGSKTNAGINVVLQQQVTVDVKNVDAKEIGEQVKQQTEEVINKKLVAALRDLSSPEVA